MEKQTDMDSIEILLTIKSPELSKDKGFENMSPDTRMPYHHPNYIGHQQTNRRKNQYAKLSRDPTLLRRSSSMKSYHHKSHYQTKSQRWN